MFGGYAGRMPLALCAVLAGGALAAAGAPAGVPRAVAHGTATEAGCPAGWTCESLGKATGGEVVNTDGSWSVTGSGSGIHGGGSPDYLHMITQPVSGDAQVVAQVVSQGSTLVKPEAGIMLRASNDPRAPFFALVMFVNDPGEHEIQPKIDVFSRTVQGGTVTQYTKVYPVAQPVWLMAQRHGNSFTASTSRDGAAWQLIPGTQHTLSLPATLLGGVFVSSENSSDVETADFAGVGVGAPSVEPKLPRSKHGCPAGWSCQDINDTAPVGDQVLSGGTWTVTGTGKAIGGREDSFNLVDQALTGDGAVSAQLQSVGAAAPTSAAGVMMRATLDPGSPYYAILVTAGQGARVSWRATAGSAASPDVQVAIAAPAWLQVTRVTDAVSGAVTYTAFTSTDGVSWTVVPGTATVLDLGAGGTLAGMAADAVKPGGTNPAVFAAVSIG